MIEERALEIYKEAKAVVKAAIEHYKEYGHHKSLG